MPPSSHKAGASPRSDSTLETRLLRAWQARGLLPFALLPLAVLFGTLTAARRLAYRLGWLRSVRLPVPVIIIGNITVGGVGKTPLTIHLVEALRRLGRRPGVISRGYGGRVVGICAVGVDSRATEVGDEPLLIARRTGVPVVVGRDRVAAAQALLAAHPEVDVLLSDDGLQHYRLERDAEVVVFDGRGVMNGWLLPAGPLREPVERLAGVDAVVINAAEPAIAVSPAPTCGASAYRMRLQSGRLYRLNHPEQTTDITAFAGERVHALAGIGHPQRFFEQLTVLGIAHDPLPFPDHHAYAASDLPSDGRPIVTTEKDAVKLTAVAPAYPGDIWVLPVDCLIEPDVLAARLLEKIHGPSLT